MLSPGKELCILANKDANTNTKCTNTKIVLLSPGEELGILASEDATVRPVQLAGDAFHLQGTDQRDFRLKDFYKWKKSRGYLPKDD